MGPVWEEWMWLTCSALCSVQSGPAGSDPVGDWLDRLRRCLARPPEKPEDPHAGGAISGWLRVLGPRTCAKVAGAAACFARCADMGMLAVAVGCAYGVVALAACAGGSSQTR